MIKSMTGFGKGESSFESKIIVVEIRTLNSKNLDINSRISYNYKELESEFRKEIANSLKRGKVDISIYEKSVGEESPSKINKEVVKNYVAQLKKLSKNSKIDFLSIAMRLPDTMKTEKEDVSDNEKTEVLSLFKNTLKKVIDFRSQEGRIIFDDFNNRLALIEDDLKAISKIDQNRVLLVKEKLKNSLGELKINIDENRFEQELIYYLEKYDITEEKVRLNNHINYFRETLSSKESNGKKLGFVLQEMGREINTIGSKANDFKLQKIVVQMKDELEKIKEQLLNLL
ncbi:MAG: hypothetical protein ACI914_001104 [Candidatus Marivariicella framensis]|jgi:uncharacterized protein (TIGR00255 family)|tara:strand:- start:8648 stop:9505 length:858 start_codon:yes stop_codon:yes gene_type:complete